MFRDNSPSSDIDDDDGFFDRLPTWNLPNMSSRFGTSSVFDNYPRRANMRPAFRSHFDSEPFFRNPSGWLDEEMRSNRGDSPMDSRRSPTPQNSRGGSGSPGTSNQPFFNRYDMTNGFPNKMRQQGSRSSTPTSANNDSDNRSENDVPDSPIPAPGVEKHPGVTSKVNSTNFPQTAKHQPKVHHIPIRVEAREEQNEPSERASAFFRVPSPFQQNSQTEPLPKEQSPKPIPRRKSQTSAKEPSRSTVHIIPVQVDETSSNDSNATANNDAKQNAQQSPMTPPTPPSKPSPSPSEINRPASTKPSPLEVIQTTLRELEKWRSRVGQFKGSRTDKEYLFLDEMLTRELIVLDNIVVEGKEDLRQARKAAIMQVNNCIHELERRVITSPEESATETESVKEEEKEKSQKSEVLIQDDNSDVSAEVAKMEEEENDQVKQSKEFKEEESEKGSMEVDSEPSTELENSEMSVSESSTAPQSKTFTTSMNVQIMNTADTSSH